MAARGSAKAMEKSQTLLCFEPVPSGMELVEEDDQAWADRCEHWLGESRKANRRQAVRERSKQPLVLCGHGVLLRVEGGAVLEPPLSIKG